MHKEEGYTRLQETGRVINVPESDDEDVAPIPKTKSEAALDNYRMREHGGATHMDHSEKVKIERCVKNIKRPPTAKTDPGNAMSELIRHVQLDPDGGLANLGDSSQSLSAGAQLSKIEALKKSPSEIAVAFIGIVRGITNPLFILCTGIPHLNMIAHGHRSRASTSALRQNHISVTYIITAMDIIECGTVIFMVLKVCWDLACMLWASRNFDPSKTSGLSAHPRYVFLATLYWTDLPFLQNFSGLKALEYVHPELISKNAREFFSLHHQASRRFLERFLGTGRDTLSDEELAEDVTKLLVHYDHAADPENEQRAVAYEYLRKSPYDLSKAVLQSSLSSNEDKMFQAKCNPSALRLARWISCIVSAESLAFFVIASVVFCAGCLVFFAKFCIVSRALTDENTEFSWIVLLLASFLNQVLGIISVNQLLLWRLETFIFGGSDASVSPEERYLLQVYLANLAQRVWASDFISTSQKFAIMIQLDDDDLQQLIVEEDAQSKSSCIISVKQFMYQTGVSRPSVILGCLDPEVDGEVGSRVLQTA